MQCAGMAAAYRVSCCRSIEDELETLARAVKDMDLLFAGSVHAVHRYPNACRAFLLTAGISPSAGGILRIMQVSDKFCFRIYCVNGGYTHLAPATLSTTASRKEQMDI